MKSITQKMRCPGCGRMMTVRFNQMYPGNVVRCSCGSSIKFQGDDMRKAQRSLDKFERDLKRMFR